MIIEILIENRDELLKIEESSECLAGTPKAQVPTLYNQAWFPSAEGDKRDLIPMIEELAKLGRSAVPLLQDIAQKEGNPKTKKLVLEILSKYEHT